MMEEKKANNNTDIQSLKQKEYTPKSINELTADEITALSNSEKGYYTLAQIQEEYKRLLENNKKIHSKIIKNKGNKKNITLNRDKLKEGREKMEAIRNKFAGGSSNNNNNNSRMTADDMKLLKKLERDIL